MTENAGAGLNGRRHYSGNGHWAGRLGNVYTRNKKVGCLESIASFDVS